MWATWLVLCSPTTPGFLCKGGSMSLECAALQQALRRDTDMRAAGMQDCTATGHDGGAVT